MWIGRRALFEKQGRSAGVFGKSLIRRFAPPSPALGFAGVEKGVRV
jgi:hypothetical protein